ncbi:hypothetical protein E4T43_00477 [Aureobasidium subglaciale]|nr:hypothetical protein E4T43_00477 [Aureobasidium subglaciale]
MDPPSATPTHSSNRRFSPSLLPDRDHVVDADSSHSRKRPRLSHELDTPLVTGEELTTPSDPQSNSAESPLIFEVPQEEPTDPSEFAIIMTVDEQTDMGNFTKFPFQAPDRRTCELAAAGLAQHCQRDTAPSLGAFQQLSDWLDKHLSDTEADFEAALRPGSTSTEIFGLYSDHTVFWNDVLRCFQGLSRRTYLNNAQDFRGSTAFAFFERLLQSLLQLGERLLYTDIAVLKQREARRDSTSSSDHTDPPKHNLLFLFWADTYMDVVAGSKGGLVRMASRFAFNAPSLRKGSLLKFQGRVMDAIVTIFEQIVSKPDSIASLFGLAHPYMMICLAVMLDDSTHDNTLLSDFPRKLTRLFELVWTLTIDIMPKQRLDEYSQSIIERLQPFLEQTLGYLFVKKCLSAATVYSMTMEHVIEYSIYQRDLLGPAEVDQTGSADNSKVQDDLCTDLNEEDLLHVARNACDFEFLNALMHSSSMELRNRALDRFGDSARRLYLDKGTLSLDQHEQIKQFIRKFIQAKDVLGFLYGSQSHATLIGRTGPILMIMTQSQRLAKSDADILWTTSINAQQPDESQTAMRVLQGLVQHMPLSVKEYFCNKFRDLDLSRLTASTERLLGTFLTNPLRDSVSRNFNSTHICISLLHKVEDSALSVNRQNYLLTKLGDMLLSIHSSDDVQENIRLVEICVQPIVACSTKATGYVQALSCLLRQTGFPLESCEILSRLSFRLCVEELKHFLGRARNKTTPLSVNALRCRLELAFRMLSISSPYDDTVALEKEVWDNVLGSGASSSTVRDVGWRFFVNLFRKNDSQLEAFYQRCITQYLPKLPPDFASYEMMPLFELQAKRQESDPTVLLPLGEELTRLALCVSQADVANRFGDILMNSLFKDKALEYPDLAVSEQVMVVKKCVLRVNLGEPWGLRACHMLLVLLGLSRKFHITLELAKGTASSGSSDKGAELSQDDIQIPIRVLKGNAQPQSKVVTLNKSASCSDLDAAIVSETGFTNYTVVSQGKKIDFAELPEKPIAQLGLPEGNVLVVQKCNTLESIQEDLNQSAEKSAVETEMLAHLDTLYDVLGGSSPAAHSMLQILSGLGFPGPIRAMISSPETPFEKIFPPEPSLRLRASVEVIGTQLREQVALGVADETFLLRGVHLLIDLLHRIDIIRNAPDAVRTADILFTLLRERPASEIAEKYFKDAAKFTQRIYSMIEQSQRDIALTGRDGFSQLAICALYKCLLESTLLHHSVCSAFFEAQNSATVHLDLLLTKSNHVRAAIPSIIINTVQDDRASPQFKKFLARMFIDRLIPAVLMQPESCDNGFLVGLTVIRADQSLPEDEALLRSMIDVFSKELLELKHMERFGDCYADTRLQGLVLLLRFCVTALKSQSKPLDLGSLASRMFKSLLFPILKLDQVVQPVITSSIRREIYDLLLSMCDNGQAVEDLAKSCETLAGYSTVDEDFVYPGPDKYIRQEGNYAGLANLGQTCYFNALMQQLYMNVQFRKLILDTPVVEYKKQTVLAEMKLAFASMQDSHDIFYQPDTLTEALGIDSSLQDDAQIFFMGMIGKLEESMPDEEAKTTLKRFFHGVNKSQTVGSCGHVSESTDEYVNLTLVVKGKETLDDSLAEYTSGSALEGSDKFRCTTCGSGDGVSVDAVRRTGLEHIPDNLVLGLRRFRYETYDGGQKVNDRFEFPERIDMSKYKLHRLAGHEGSREPDDFRLVGVVVHQGILNFGHYWSYAAERGCTGSGPLRWYRFEDKLVRPSSIEEVLNETRGGYETTRTGILGGMSQSLRSDNAFVLFYQRSSAITESAQCLGTLSPHAVQAKVSLPEEIDTKIVKNNELKMLIQNISSPSHLEFIRTLAGRLKTLQNIDVVLNFRIMSMLMIYLTRIIANFAGDYAPDSIDLHVALLKKTACEERSIATWTLQTILPPRDGDNISTSLVLHRRHKTRGAIGQLLLACLRYLHDSHPQVYGLEKGQNDKVMENTILGVIDVRNLLFDRDFATWREYFELVRGVAELGLEETNVLLEQGVLEWCFEVLLLNGDTVLQMKHADVVRYSNNSPWSVNYPAIINCIHGLLFHFVDLCGSAASSARARINDSQTLLLLTDYEQSFLSRRSEIGCNFLVEICMQGLPRPRGYHWQRWPPTKLTVLLANAERMPPQIYDDSVKAMIINLCTTTASDTIAESVCLSLLERKMKSATEEDIFLEMGRILTHLKPPAAPDLRWILAQVYKLQPLMIMHHLAELTFRLLVCDLPDVEENTRDWLKTCVLQTGLTKPYALNDVSVLHRKVTAIRDLYNRLAHELNAALTRNQSCIAYKHSIDAYKDCYSYLRQISTALETELEEWLESDPPKTEEAAELETAVQTLCDNIGDIDCIIDTHTDFVINLHDWQGDDSDPYSSMIQVDDESDNELVTDESLSEVAEFEDS